MSSNFLDDSQKNMETAEPPFQKPSLGKVFRADKESGSGYKNHRPDARGHSNPLYPGNYEMPEFIEICEKSARAGGAILRDWTSKLGVREKGPADLVTKADLAAQEAVREVILGHFPDHEFRGEEDSPAENSGSEFVWHVDPLDGTTNYVHGVPFFCTSVALEHRGKLVAGAVYNPISEECFTASLGQGAWLGDKRLSVSDTSEISAALIATSFPTSIASDSPQIGAFLRVLKASRSIRRTGSAALNLCFLAAGRYDAYWALSMKPWDVAAGVLLVREAGGIVTAPNGEPFDLQKAVFASAASGSLHRQLLDELKDT